MDTVARTGVRSAVVVLACWLSVSPAPAQRPASGGGTIPQVLLDIDVRDAGGRPVKNLQPGDVEIYEDGVKQQLQRFRLAGGEPRQLETRSDASPLPGIRLVCIVFHNLDTGTRKYAIEAVQEFLNRELRSDTYAAVFGLDDRLTVLHPFTNQYAALVQAAQRAVGAAAATGELKVSGGEPNLAAIAGAEVGTGRGANIAPADAILLGRSFVNIEGKREIDQMMTMVQQLGSLPGRKTVLLLSPGLTLTGAPDELRALVSAAIRSNLGIYAVDTQGIREISTSAGSIDLVGHSAFTSATQTPSPTADRVIETFERSREQSRRLEPVFDGARTSNTQAGLRALSEGTGGFLIATNELRRPFARVIEDMDTRYQAAYSPSAVKLDGRRRKIEIKAVRPGLTVHSRTAYFALPDLGSSLKPFETTALAALSDQPPPRAFDFQAGAFRFRPEAAASEVAVAFELPGANLTTTAVPSEQRHRFHVSLLALVKDADGSVVDKVSQDFVAAVPQDRLERLRAGNLSLTRSLKLPPGHYTIDTAVLDQEGNKSSTGSFEFDNPERAGLALSDIVLVQRLEAAGAQPDAKDPFQSEGTRVIPQITATLATELQPYLYFVVYPDKSNPEKPEVTLQLRVDGSVVSEHSAELPADESGAIPVVIAAVAKPGNCELKVTASQGDDTIEQTLKYTLVKK